VQPRHVQGAVSAPALGAIFRRMQTVLWKVDDNRSMKCSRAGSTFVAGLTVLAFMPSSGTVSSLPRIHVQ